MNLTQSQDRGQDQNLGVHLVEGADRRADLDQEIGETKTLGLHLLDPYDAHDLPDVGAIAKPLTPAVHRDAVETPDTWREVSPERLIVVQNREVDLRSVTAPHPNLALTLAAMMIRVKLMFARYLTLIEDAAIRVGVALAAELQGDIASGGDLFNDMSLE
jgi:hypothetical protein